jgi:hypothetical protein
MDEDKARHHVQAQQQDSAGELHGQNLNHLVE